MKPGYALLLFLALLSSQCSLTLGTWIYPPISVQEGRVKVLPREVVVIKSDEPAVKNYVLSGEGVEPREDYDHKFKFDIVTIMEDGKTSGVLRQLNDLDREKKAVYHVIASALDKNGEKVEDDTPLEIKVTDINDNVPEFILSTLEGSVTEASGPSSPSFMTIKATDADEGYNAEVVYSVVSNGDTPPSENSRFAIDQFTGDVTVVGKLDFETSPTVTFKVIAEDGGGVQPGLKATATATVSVLDANDHAPMIDVTAPKSVSELFPENVSFYEITATDVDTGVNKKTYFDIVGGNIADTFYIDSLPSDTGKSIGKLKLAKMLDYETPPNMYDLVIKAYNKDAKNGDNDEFASTTTVHINVIDENEPPIFQNTPYNVPLTEDTDDETPPEGPGSPLVTVEAKDLDFDSNQTVTYSISDDPESWFEIDKKTGVVRKVGKVDRESPYVTHSDNEAVYFLEVTATDNYDHGEKASANSKVSIFINDLNDNPPSPIDGEKVAIVCEKPANSTVTIIEASDPDSSKNGPPFIFRFDPNVSPDKWYFSKLTPTTQEVSTLIKDFDLSSNPEQYLLPYTITDSGSPKQTGTATLTVSVCRCVDGDTSLCSTVLPAAAGFPIVAIIAILIVLLLIIILILAAVTYRRRRDAATLKEPFFNDEDDIRENLQVYQEEGGEEDQDAYDLSALQAPLMNEPNAPVRVEKPLQAAPQPRMPRGGIPDDIGDYIGEAKVQADSDPSAPPFDSLLVFDYEGTGSDAGSLSSINTATTDGSMDYDYLNDWGPRFKRLADMYNAGSESD